MQFLKFLVHTIYKLSYVDMYMNKYVMDFIGPNCNNYALFNFIQILFVFTYLFNFYLIFFFSFLLEVQFCFGLSFDFVVKKSCLFNCHSEVNASMFYPGMLCCYCFQCNHIEVSSLKNVVKKLSCRPAFSPAISSSPS